MKYKPKHSTLAKIWGRTGENAVFFVPPSTIYAYTIAVGVASSAPPPATTLGTKSVR